MTRIYALTDSHQESSNLSKLLSGIYNFEKDNNEPFLILDCGDLFKGIYDRDLSVNAYLKIKELLPNAQIFMTSGNNDFGFTKESFEYFKSTVKKFNDAGIRFVCANIFENKTGLPADWISQYKILKINGQKILITGFCVNNSCAKRFGYGLKSPEECFEKLLNSIDENSYDKIVVLNHHWYAYSKSLKDFAKRIGKNIDLIIGGHEHSKIMPDFENNIFYPLAFARTVYRMELNNDITNVEEFSLNDVSFIPELESPIKDYEYKTNLKKPLAKRVLDLTKCYSDPCPLGTFISDCMKEVGKTDIAFHSTGFTMYSLRLDDGDFITMYDLQRVICANSEIEKIEIDTAQLKEVFENATKNRMYRNQGNSRFVQCSRNIAITGVGNPKNKTYKILQININGEDLLDKNQEPINPKKIFTCTIDSYIGVGEQGFEVLKNIPKTKILYNNKSVALNELFYNKIINAENFYTSGSMYPSFKLTDLGENQTV